MSEPEDDSWYCRELDRLAGSRCDITIAADTLKIWFPELPRGENANPSYIWVDPPWVFGGPGDSFVASAGYPGEDDPDFRARFREWAGGIEPLRGTVLEDYQLGRDDSLHLYFSGGLKVVVPYDGPHDERDEDDWYDHWYAVSPANAS